MFADFFTKPLQGSLFRKFWDVIMDHKHIDSLKETATAQLQELVGLKDMRQNVRNGDDIRKADERALEPVSSTYADIVRKGCGVLNRLNRLKVRGARTALTFKK